MSASFLTVFENCEGDLKTSDYTRVSALITAGTDLNSILA